MAFDFPTAPAVDDPYTDPVSGAAYTYDGEKWVSSGGGGGGGTTPPAGDFLPLTGGTMTGAILLPAPNPAVAEEATHKKYVDETIAASSLYQSIWQVAANTPDLTPSVVNALHSYSWVASTADPMVKETAPAGLPGIGGTQIGMNDTIVWNATLAVYEHLKSASAAGAYLPLTGGTLSGNLAVTGTIDATGVIRAPNASIPILNNAVSVTGALTVTGNTTLNGATATVAGQIVVANGIRVTNHKAVSIEGTGTLAVGGATTLNALTVNDNAVIAAGKTLTINHRINYNPNTNNFGFDTNNGCYHNTALFHTFWVGGAQKFGIDLSGVTVYGTITDSLVADAVKKDPNLPGKNIGALLLHALAEIKTLKAEVAALKARK